MTTRNMAIRMIGALCAALALGACIPQTAQWSGTEPVKRNQVELVRFAHDVRFPASGASLTAAEAAAIGQFLESVQLRYGDRLALDLGQDAEGRVSAANSARAKAVRDHLASLGHELAAATVDHGAAPDAGTLRLVVERYVVTLPPCPDWRQPASPNYNNAPTGNLGCANVTALGMMVANPRDLVAPETYEPLSGEVQSRGVNKLNEDKVKWRAGSAPSTINIVNSN